MGLKIVSNGQELNVGAGNGEVYSTEETRIGTWIDGKPLYRRVYSSTTPNQENTHVKVITGLASDLNVVKIMAYLYDPQGSLVPIPYIDPDQSVAATVYWQKQSQSITMSIRPLNWFGNRPCHVTIEYTKTADPATVNVPQSSLDVLLPETKSIASSAKEVW